MAVHHGSHNEHQAYTGQPVAHVGPPRIKVPYSKNPVFVAEGYKPPVVAGRSFEYETTPENAEYWQTLSLAYRQYLKRLLLDERRSGAFRCVGCGKPMVMRELFANGDRVYQCLNGDCVKRIIRYQYQAYTGRIAEVA